MISCSVSAPGRLVVDDRERAQVFLPDRQDAPVVVAALALDGLRVAGERPGLLGRHLVELLEVDDQARRRLGGRRRAAVGEQLADRDAVEVGELGELLDGDRAVAALVGADDDGLPPLVRLLLDAVERETLLRDGWPGAVPRAPWRSRSLRTFRLARPQVGRPPGDPGADGAVRTGRVVSPLRSPLACV